MKPFTNSIGFLIGPAARFRLTRLRWHLLLRDVRFSLLLAVSLLLFSVMAHAGPIRVNNNSGASVTVNGVLTVPDGLSVATGSDYATVQPEGYALATFTNAEPFTELVLSVGTGGAVLASSDHATESAMFDHFRRGFTQGCLICLFGVILRMVRNYGRQAPASVS